MIKMIYVITVTNDYSLDDQLAFTDEEKAFAQWEKMLKEYFQDEMNLAIEEGLVPDNISIEDYQYSDCWWDNDNRTKITLREVELL